MLVCLIVLLGGQIGSAPSLAASRPAVAPILTPATEPTAPDAEPAAISAFAPYAYWQGSTDAYVAVPHDADLSPQTGATFEAWIFLSSTAGCRTIFSKGYTQGYWVGVCNGRIRYASGAAATYTEGATAILPNVWTHIAVVWDPTFNVRRFFINGDFDVLAPAGPAPTGTRELRIAGEQPDNTLLGFIAEARIWNVARDQADIRRTMHSYVDEKIPGLVAVWPFRADFTDVIGGRRGTTTGTSKGIFSVGTDAVHPFPLRPATVAADELFNALPHRRDSAGSAYLPHRDRLLLIGGNVNATESNRVDAVEGGTGDFTALGVLPVTLSNPAAAYAPESDKVYVFGGRSSGVDQKAIYAIDPATGAVNTLAATLPEAINAPAAVYHPGLRKIFILGGVINDTTPVDRVSVFDPATETLAPAGFALPARRFMLAAAYSTATNSIFTFGGIGDGGAPANDIYELRAGGDGTTGRVAPAAVTLAAADSGLVVVEDGQTKLIYLLGGATGDRPWAFDPGLGQLWRTPIELPALRNRPAALYSPANRHALLIGGLVGNQGQTNVWKFPLGDGPAVKLGRWDFEFAGGTVNDMDGGWDRLIVGTTTGATVRTEGSTAVYTPAALGGTNVRLVRYEPSSGRTWFVVDNNRIVYTSGSSILKLWPADTTEKDLVLDFNPYGDTPVIGTAVNTDVPQGYGTLLWRWGIGGFISWEASWEGCYNSSALVNRASNQVWGLVIELHCGPRALSLAPDQMNEIGDTTLRELTYNWLNGQATEQNYGKICVSGAFVPEALAFGKNGDLWVAGSTGVCRYPAAAIPGTPGVTWRYNVMNLPTGPGATAPSVDSDGRVWLGVKKDATHSGGMTVFEVLGKDPNRQSVWTTDYTWLNAPIGSKAASGTADYDSSVTAVFANGERVWSARGSQIFTVAQRWQQLDERNGLRNKALTGIWTVRGRLFVATADELFILQPDGVTWENWAIAGVKAIVADRQGRIWVGATEGVRLYAGSAGFIAPPSPTPAPAGAITALAADGQGRIWIGGATGVTLYDRERFVTTLVVPTGGAITSLLADRDDVLWVGTDAGLARFDPATATWRSFTTANGLPNNSVSDVVQLRNGWLAISHAGGVVQYRGDETFVGYSIAGAHLPLTVDDRGRLWAGGSVVDGDAWQSYTGFNSGLRATTVADNVADGADRIWFAHPDGGISVRGSTLPPLAESVPLISGMTPRAGRAGDEITIQGSGFGTDRTAIEVTIGGVPTEVRAVSDSSIAVRLNERNISGAVSVVKNRKRRTTASDTFCAIPVITGVTPSGGNAGVEVKITGTNFDPDAMVSLGGAGRRPWPSSTREMKTTIESSDATGFVKVTNHCGNNDTWRIPFNKIDLTIDQLVLSQGLPDQPLLYARSTLVQSFLRRSAEVRSGDRLEIDGIFVTFTDPRNGATTTHYSRNLATVPTSPNSTTDARMADINHSLNAANVIPIVGQGFTSGDLEVKVELKNRGRPVAQATRTVRFERNVTLRVILVPIMDKGRGDQLGSALQAMKANTDRNLDQLRRRIMPTGNVEFVWADNVLVHDAKLDLDSSTALFSFAPQLDRARTRWNDRTTADALVAVGVVDPQLVIGSVTGKGFWPDVSEMANTLALDVLDTLCDVGNAVVNTVSFGLLGSDTGCNLNIPLYIAWARGDDGVRRQTDMNGMNPQAQVSALFGHEMGHALGLVKPWAPNGSLHDNLSHSVNDEIGPRGDLTTASKSCSQLNEPGAFFDWGLSFYRQPGVRLPVVNPTSGGQLRPQNDGTYFGPRAKAIMSYACARYNTSVFFESADTIQIRLTMADAGIPVALSQRANAAAQADGQARLIVGERLHVAGTVNRATGSGQFTRVEQLGEAASLSPGFNTGYWLVQLNAAGAELARLGVFPLFDLVDHEENAPIGPSNPLGFFSATLLKAEGAVALQLRQGDTVLATFAPGSAAPQVTLHSPTGGANFSDGSINVTWTASDSDGDPLEVAVDYSADGGATWTPVGAARGGGSGSVSVPVILLAGSPNARMRVTASDGLRTGSATSAAFRVAAQAPLAIIGQPEDGASFGEAELIQLSGGASDNQDGPLSGAALTWRSDRDGELGHGAMLAVPLSVGSHVLTLRAVNSSGLASEASVQVTVAGDYDGDVILDTQETTGGLNPLTAADALSDADGDGLDLRVERGWGTDPNRADSDGDSRSDGDEIVASTNPTAGDAPLPPDQLQVYPPALAFAADLATDTLPAQQILQLVSRVPATWTVTLGAKWLRTSATGGTTPAATTFWVQPAALADGVHTGSIQISSALGTVTVPVTVTVTNKANYCDTNRDGALTQADVTAVAARVGSQAGQAGYSYRYDLNRDGVIDVQDVALAQACLDAIGPGRAKKIFLPLIVRSAGGNPPMATPTATRPAATSTPTRTPTATRPAATSTPTRTPTATRPAATSTSTRTPTATPTSPSTADLIVYSDALTVGWEDWSWDTTVNFAATAHVKTGSKSIAITHTAAWGGFSLRAPTAINTASYSAIRFWVYGHGKSLALSIQPSDAGPVSPFFAFTPAAGMWTQITVPLNALGSPAQIQRINVQENAGAAAPIFYLDDVRLVGAGQ